MFSLTGNQKHYEQGKNAAKAAFMQCQTATAKACEFKEYAEQTGFCNKLKKADVFDELNDDQEYTLAEYLATIQKSEEEVTKKVQEKVTIFFFNLPSCTVARDDFIQQINDQNKIPAFSPLDQRVSVRIHPAFGGVNSNRMHLPERYTLQQVCVLVKLMFQRIEKNDKKFKEESLYPFGETYHTLKTVLYQAQKAKAKATMRKEYEKKAKSERDAFISAVPLYQADLYDVLMDDETFVMEHPIWHTDMLQSWKHAFESRQNALAEYETQMEKWEAEDEETRGNAPTVPGNGPLISWETICDYLRVLLPPLPRLEQLHSPQTLRKVTFENSTSSRVANDDINPLDVDAENHSNKKLLKKEKRSSKRTSSTSSISSSSDVSNSSDVPATDTQVQTTPQNPEHDQLFILQSFIRHLILDSPDLIRQLDQHALNFLQHYSNLFGSVLGVARDAFTSIIHLMEEESMYATENIGQAFDKSQSIVGSSFQAIQDTASSGYKSLQSTIGMQNRTQTIAAIQQSNAIFAPNYLARPAVRVQTSPTQVMNSRNILSVPVHNPQRTMNRQTARTLLASANNH